MSRLSTHELCVEIGTVRICDDLNLAVQAGEFWALLGANGVGKTTLLRVLAGLHPPRFGAIEVNGRSIREYSRRQLARRLGMLQQHTSYVFDSTVEETVLIGRHPHLGYWQRESASDQQLARQVLAEQALDGFENRSLASLSGGEARRVAFATLLLQQTDIMLLDEPTNHLDLHHQLGIMTSVRRLCGADGRVAIAALHDVNLALGFCSHALMLFGDGQWCAGPIHDMLSEASLESLYHCPIERVDTPSGTRYLPRSEPVC